MKKTLKKLLSLSLACAMLLSMGVSAFATDHYAISPVGTIDENGMRIIDSKVLEVFEDGSYIVASTLKSPFETFATGGTVATVKYDFKKNNGTIFHTITLHGDFKFDNVAKIVQFGSGCNYQSTTVQSTGSKFTNFATSQTFGLSKQTAKYTLKFTWVTSLGFERNQTMYVQSDYTGKTTSSGNQSITES